MLSGTAQSEHTRRHTFAVPGRRQGLCRAAWAPGWLLGAPPRLAPALGSPCSPAAAPALGWKRPNPATACPEDLGSVAVAAVAGPAHAHPMSAAGRQPGAVPGLYSIRQGSDRAHLFKMKNSPPSTSCLGGWPSSIVPHLAPAAALRHAGACRSTGLQRSTGAGAPPCKTLPCYTPWYIAQHARRKDYVTNHASDMAVPEEAGTAEPQHSAASQTGSLPCRACCAPDDGVVIGVRHAHDALCVRRRHLHRVVLSAPRRVQPARRGRRPLERHIGRHIEAEGVSSTVMRIAIG